MADVIAECKERTYDFSWLPNTLGDFKLVIDTTAEDLYYRFFIMKMNWDGVGKLCMIRKLTIIQFM